MHHPDDSPACLGAASGWLAPGGPTLPLPALNDEEGPRLPEGLPPVVDAHVHLFPDGVFEAVWRWFDQYGWPIRYKLHTPQVVSFLLSRGVHRVVALHYAHKPGMARFLNSYIAEVARAEPRVLGLATVLPGEEGAADILAEAFASGLKGVKLHCHVQCFAPDAPALHEVYAACARAGRPLVMHAGREPASPQYKCDVHALCSAERVERVLKDHPGLKLCIPHLGADEFDAYERLLERHDNLWLDTTMAVAGYFPIPVPRRLLDVRPERILYGTDFPNLPYAWDRELKQLLALKLGDEAEAGILGQNALQLFEGC
ncbi:amidohydrolase family protein [Archangium lansingense]|uniref:Amidohydrolase family protein n=1 Tax=Archangium lansingense TaxID=2995310 RepID=A0ABT4A0A5_9BACT|nr:amidohydrolase family protein [Archangium lansinium]MCY1075078.1 amidohydrolase family protein [Archangium lansinium]